MSSTSFLCTNATMASRTTLLTEFRKVCRNTVKMQRVHNVDKQLEPIDSRPCQPEGQPTAGPRSQPLHRRYYPRLPAFADHCSPIPLPQIPPVAPRVHCHADARARRHCVHRSAIVGRGGRARGSISVERDQRVCAPSRTHAHSLLVSH